jgi:4-hydroxybenzoate polyprenyltransferase
MKLGVYSISILLGYEGSKKALLPLTLLYLGALAYALRICGLHWMPITAVPAVVLIREALSVRMEDPKSCGIYTRNGTYVKLGVFVASAVDFVVSHA